MKQPYLSPDEGENAPAYTQEEANALVEARLSEERRRFEQEMTAQRTAREQAEKTLFALQMREKGELALRERGLPASLLGALRLENENALRESLQCAETAFRNALEEGVRERLRPGAAPAPKPQNLSKLTYRQAARLYESNPNAYEKQFGGM